MTTTQAFRISLSPTRSEPTSHSLLYQRPLLTEWSLCFMASPCGIALRGDEWTLRVSQRHPQSHHGEALCKILLTGIQTHRMRQNSRRTTLVALLIAVPLGILLIVVASRWDALPGTFYRDDQGVAHGTGVVTYNYKPGVKQVVEQYYRGQLVRSEWFRRDGTSIQVTLWEDESGEGLYLRKDGSV